MLALDGRSTETGGREREREREERMDDGEWWEEGGRRESGGRETEGMGGIDT